MRILFLTVGPDNVASSRVRVYQFLNYLRQAGIKGKVIPLTPKNQAQKLIHNKRKNVLDEISERLFRYAGILKIVFLCGYYDVVVIQKICLPAAFVYIIKKLNQNIVFDFDDAIFRYRNSSNQRLQERFNYILRNCKCVIAGNAFLKQKALSLNDRVHNLPSPVDTNRIFPKTGGDNTGNAVVIGWIGSPDSSAYLNGFQNVFKALLKKFVNLKFEFVGADSCYQGLDGFTIKNWSFDREAEDLRNFDIGIMPINNDEWSKGKCGYKLLQYMAAGIPCVASPVGVNCEFVKDGVNGFLAHSEEKWIEKLTVLIKDSRLRLAMGLAGRKIAVESYSYEIIAPKLIAYLRMLKTAGSR